MLRVDSAGRVAGRKVEFWAPRERAPFAGQCHERTDGFLADLREFLEVDLDLIIENGFLVHAFCELAGRLQPARSDGWPS